MTPKDVESVLRYKFGYRVHHVVPFKKGYPERWVVDIPKPRYQRLTPPPEDAILEVSFTRIHFDSMVVLVQGKPKFIAYCQGQPPGAIMHMN